jgi:hypothetical protein
VSRMTPTRADYLLHVRVRAGPADPPPEVALRRALKLLWRACRVRCVAVRPAPPPPDRRDAP